MGNFYLNLKDPAPEIVEDLCLFQCGDDCGLLGLGPQAGGAFSFCDQADYWSVTVLSNWNSLTACRTPAPLADGAVTTS